MTRAQGSGRRGKQRLLAGSPVPTPRHLRERCSSGKVRASPVPGAEEGARPGAALNGASVNTCGLSSAVMNGRQFLHTSLVQDIRQASQRTEL